MNAELIAQYANDRGTVDKMKTAILNLVKSNETVSFAELARNISRFEGNLPLSLEEYPNIVYWFHCSKEAIQSLIELREEKQIFVHPSSYLLYLLDGCVPNSPIATRLRHYQKPHWCPVVFCSFPYRKHND